MFPYVFALFLVISTGNLPSKGMRKNLGLAWKAITGNVDEFA